MNKRFLLLVTAALVLPSHTIATQLYDNWPDVAGPYVGQEPPSMTAEMFAPGFISTDRSEINSVFAPDGREFYFTTWTVETGTKIMVTSQIDGRWSRPVMASFSNHNSDVDPAFSHDGKRVFVGDQRQRMYGYQFAVSATTGPL